MSPVSQVRDPGHVTKVTRFGPYFWLGVSLKQRTVNGHSSKNWRTLQNSVCVYSEYIFAGQVFYRSYVLRHIRLRSFAVNNLFLSGLNVGISRRTATDWKQRWGTIKFS